MCRPVVAVLSVLLLAGCEHSEPFAASAPEGGERWVVAEVQGPLDAFGFPGPADLWLFQVP